MNRYQKAAVLVAQYGFWNAVARVRSEEMGAGGAAMLVGFMVVALLASAFIPAAITAITDTDTTGWDSSAVVIWGILPVIIIVGLLFWFLKRGGVSGKGGGI